MMKSQSISILQKCKKLCLPKEVIQCTPAKEEGSGSSAEAR